MSRGFQLISSNRRIYTVEPRVTFATVHWAILDENTTSIEPDQLPLCYDSPLDALEMAVALCNDGQLDLPL